jgi:type I restriction enzyme, S subunit
VNKNETRLKFICKFGYGDALPKDNQGTGVIPVLGSNGQFSSMDTPNTKAPVIIIGRKGSYGKINWSEVESFASDTTFFVDSSLTSQQLRWLYWALQTLKLDEGSNEAAVPGLSREIAYQKQVFVPSIEQQTYISDYIDRETTEIDALVAEKQHMLALIEEKREALISHAVTRGLNPHSPLKPSGLDWISDIPLHWRVCQLKRTWKSDDYGISENIRGEGEIKVLRMTCIDDGIVDLTKGGEVESVDPYLFLEKGDLLFNRTNSLDQVSKVGIVQSTPDRSTSFASYLVRIRTNDLAYPEFLAIYLNSQEFLTFARKNAIPAIGQANLSPSRYGEIKIAIPPKSEQKEIIDIIEKERDKTRELISALIDSIALLKERRSALITAAVTGQIEPETIDKYSLNKEVLS